MENSSERVQHAPWNKGVIDGQKTSRPVQFEITQPTRDAGTHSMRRTNASAVQLLLDQTKLESTVRYLGIEVDDALKMAEQTEI
jgi:hypothetical protein